MKLKELAKIAQKKPGTVATFFSRHNLSIRSESDIRFYFDYLKSGKRFESGLRSAKHLKQYHFKPKNQNIQKARELVKNRKLIWGVPNKTELSAEKITESVISHGDWGDFQELMNLFGKKQTASIFFKQIKTSRNNYRQETINFFKLYFHKHHAY